MGLEESDKRMAELMKDVPRVVPALAYTCAVLNVILSGSGSMIAGCVGDKDKGGMWDRTTTAIGLMQLLLAPYLIGWVWSIYWAYLIVKKARAPAMSNSHSGMRTDVTSPPPHD